MEERIEGKVAAIINNQIIVINRGEREGVREDMIFAIFTEEEKLIDPTTGESLGFFENVKVKVGVIHVQEKMCSTIGIPETIDRVGKKVQLEAIGKDGKYEDCKVIVGDFAREYIGMSALLYLAMPPISPSQICV
jgi:hypothetical protein